MPDIDDFFPPLGYDWWWWLVLPLFIALLVLWILLSKRFAGMRGWRRRGEGGPVDAQAAAAAGGCAAQGARTHRLGRAARRRR